MAKRKKDKQTNRQTTIYKTLQRKQKIEQQGRHKNNIIYLFIDYFSVTLPFNHRCICLHYYDKGIVIMISKTKRQINTVIIKTYPRIFNNELYNKVAVIPRVKIIGM